MTPMWWYYLIVLIYLGITENDELFTKIIICVTSPIMFSQTQTRSSCLHGFEHSFSALATPCDKTQKAHSWQSIA